MPPRSTPPPPQEGLLDLLATAPRVETPPDVYGAAEAYVKWLKPPAGRHLCTLCVQAIHGKTGGPSPLAATARRKGPNGEMLLCPAHAIVLKEKDEAAEKVRKERLKEERQPAQQRRNQKHREHA